MGPTRAPPAGRSATSTVTGCALTIALYLAMTWAGQNFGLAGLQPEKDSPRNAHDVKEAHRILREFTDDLKKIADELTRPKALEPGDRISAEDARGLPVGSAFRDTEGDEWFVTESGFSCTAVSTSGPTWSRRPSPSWE